MKTSAKTKNPFVRTAAKNLTFGELIAATYRACGKQKAPKILQLAIESQLIKFSRPPCLG